MQDRFVSVSVSIALLSLYDSLLLTSAAGKLNLYEDFILTASQFGVILEVYCECLLTCHHVWRSVPVLEYILVWCKSVSGCINVCRAPPALL